MFLDHSKRKIAKILDFSKEEFEEAVRRINGIGRKRNDGAMAVDILRIISEIIERRNKDEAVTRKSIKNPDVKRFWLEIVELRKFGKGGIAISKEIEKRHKVYISKTTIEKYLKLHGKWELSDG